MIKNLLLVALTFAATSVFAQNSKVQSAIIDQKYGDLDKAKEAIDDALKNEKTIGSAKAWFTAATIYRDIASSEKFSKLDTNALAYAMMCFEKTTQLDTKGEYKAQVEGQSLVMASILNNDAIKKFQAADYAGSLASFEKVMLMSQYANDTNTVFNAALAAQRANNTEKSKQLFSKLLTIGFNKPDIYRGLADIYKKEGNDDEALKTLNAASTAHPADVNIIIDQLNIYLTKGRQQEAIDKLEQAIKLDPTNAQLHFALGTTYDQLSQKKIENPVLKNIKKDMPAADVKTQVGNPISINKSEIKGGMVNGKPGKPILKEEWIYDGVKISLLNQKVSMVEPIKANNATSANPYTQKAIDNYKKSVELKADYFDGNYNLGALYFNRAAELANEANAIPYNEAARYEKALTDANNVFKQAQPYLEKALEIEPKDENTLFSLQQLYAKLKMDDRSAEMKKRKEDLKNK